MALIKIQRPKNFLGGARGFNVYIDDKKVGTISNGETKEFQIAAGEHKIYCKQDFFNTPFKHEFSIREDQTKSFVAGYQRKLMFSLLFSLGMVLSVVLSMVLTSWLKINPQSWLGFYIFFIIILLLVMRAAKLFTIYISE